jgi:hypothetical protein
VLCTDQLRLSPDRGMSDPLRPALSVFARNSFTRPYARNAHTGNAWSLASGSRARLRAAAEDRGRTGGNYISFADPDGNPIYVGDWDPNVDVEHEPHDAVGSTTP